MANGFCYTSIGRTSVAFWIGFLCGGYLFRFLNFDCVTGKSKSEISSNKFTPIFLGVITTTANRTQAEIFSKIFSTSDMTAMLFDYYAIVPENTELSVQPSHIRHFLPLGLQYEWYILTNNRLLNTTVMPPLLASIRFRTPVTVVHPSCEAASIVIIHRQALSWIQEKLNAENIVNLCQVLNKTDMLSLQKIWRHFHQSRGERDTKGPLTYTMQGNDTLKMVQKYQSRHSRLLQGRLSNIQEHVTDIAGLVFMSSRKQQQFDPTRIMKHINMRTEWSLINKSCIHSLGNWRGRPSEDLQNRGRQLMFQTSNPINLLGFCKPLYSYQKIESRTVAHIVVYNESCSRSYISIRPADSNVFSEETGVRNAYIVMIVPLFKRSSVLARFLRRLQSVSLDYKGDITLIVVLFKDNTNEYKKTLKTIAASRGPVIAKAIMSKGVFSRAKAIVKGIERIPDDPLLLIMDVDMMFTADFLERVSMTTKRGRQAYFPIQFSRYDPEAVFNKNVSGKGKSRSHLSDHRGLWRDSAFGIVGIYKSDVHKVGSFDTEIRGWGNEDVLFYTKCIKSGLAVFRSVDPGLWHIYHPRHCDHRLPPDQKRMCSASKLQLVTSLRALAEFALHFVFKRLI